MKHLERVAVEARFGAVERRFQMKPFLPDTVASPPAGQLAAAAAGGLLLGLEDAAAWVELITTPGDARFRLIPI